MLICDTTPFAISESFKMLRQNLFFTSSGESCPVYAITSSYAHTGKSVIIANTAASFADLGKKVLIIDADMRCPVIHRIFGKKSGRGFPSFWRRRPRSKRSLTRSVSHPAEADLIS